MNKKIRGQGVRHCREPCLYPCKQASLDIQTMKKALKLNSTKSDEPSVEPSSTKISSQFSRVSSGLTGEDVVVDVDVND